MSDMILQDLVSVGRPLDDPSYEPNRLYTLFGKPGLGAWTWMLVVLVVLASLVAVGISQLVL
jgi:hypothetical protein